MRITSPWGNTWALMLSQAPVLTTPSTENFFKLVFGNTRCLQSSGSRAMPAIPSPGLTALPSPTALPRPASCPRMLWEKRRCGASFTENGKEGEGMFAASVVDFGSANIAAGPPSGYIIPQADGGYYMAYNVMAVTAAKDTFIEWESVLTKCLGTLAYSESFVKATEQAGEEKVAMSKEISRITNERLEIIMAAWEDRNVRAGHHQPDGRATKPAATSACTTRRPAKSTGRRPDGMKAPASDRYKPVTENKMYAEPISGYIE